MEDQRISVATRQVELSLCNGERLSGEVFLQLQGVHLSGPQRIGELLNGEDVFLPVRVGGKVRLVNLLQVEAFYVAAAEEFDPLLELGVAHDVKVVAVSGDAFEARIFVNLPNGRTRTRDFLDQKKRFLLFLTGDQVIYMARRKILFVED